MTLLALATLALLGSCLASLTPAFGPLSWDVVVFLDLFDFFIIPTAIPLSLFLPLPDMPRTVQDNGPVDTRAMGDTRHTKKKGKAKPLHNNGDNLDEESGDAADKGSIAAQG